MGPSAIALFDELETSVVVRQQTETKRTFQRSCTMVRLCSVCDPHPYVPEGQEGEELISLLLYEWVLRESRRGMRIQGKAASWVNSR